MSKISQSVASDVAQKVAAKLDAEIKKATEKLADQMHQLYMDQLPQTVRMEFARNPYYFNATGNIYLNGVGLTGRAVQTKLVPTRRSFSASVDLDKKQAAEVVKALNRISDMKEKSKKWKLEIEAALLAVGTYKRAAENLPEIAPYLPDRGMTTALVVNLDSARKIIAESKNFPNQQ